MNKLDSQYAEPKGIASNDCDDQLEDLLYRFSNNLSRYFSSVSRDFKDRLKKRNIAAGYSGLKLSFSQVLFYLPPEGARVADLARINGVSKQAISKTVKEIEGLGFIERVSDAQDSRSKRIVLTPQGLELIKDASQQLVNVEKEYLDILGAEHFDELQMLVATLFTELDLTKPDLARYTEIVPRRVGTFGVHLSAISEEFHRRIRTVSIRKGYGGMKVSFGQVFTHLGASGVRVVDLARINDVSKQAMAKITDEIEEQGFISKIPDPHDGRSNSLVLTEKGLKLVADAVDTIDEVCGEFIAILGKERFRVLYQRMSEIYQGLSPDDLQNLSADVSAGSEPVGLAKSRSEILNGFIDGAPQAIQEVEDVLGVQNAEQLKQLLHQLLSVEK